MKIIGAGLLFLACALAGIWLGEQKKIGVAECEAFLALLRHARSRIDGFDAPTKQIWREFENETLEKNGFLAALRSAENEDVYFDAFSRAFEKTERSLHISSETKKIIRSFGGAVGKSFSEDQLAMIDVCISGMSDVFEKSKSEARRDMKLYITLGFSLGAVIFIMII